MKTTLFLLFISVLFSQANAQQYLIGKITSEDGIELGGVVVMNMNTEEKVLSDKDGIFMIKASQNNEIRFVKPRYERSSVKVSAASFNSSFRIELRHSAELIEEVEIGFVPTGNLKKDIARLEPSAKVKTLNESMSAYMKTKPLEASPQLRMPSTLQTGPNYSAGQVNILGLLGFLAKKIQKHPTTANYAEQQAFYRRVKEEVNMEHYTKYGLDEFAFEQLLVYADRKYELSKNFRTNFSIATIDNYLKMALKDFLNSKNTVATPDSIKS